MSPALASSDSLPDAVGRRIRSRVGRRVRNVVVLHDHKSLVVRGHATSYHAWQLVIAECQAALAKASDDIRLDCVLRVDPAPRKTAPQYQRLRRQGVTSRPLGHPTQQLSLRCE